MFIKVYNRSGVEVPIETPSRGLNHQGQQLVDAARNSKGQVVAQPINRRLVKIDGLEWKFLTDDQWSTILNLINDFEGWVEYYDPADQKILKMRIYWGDYSAEPFMIDPDTGRVESWVNCKCNIIDMGYARTIVRSF